MLCNTSGEKEFTAVSSSKRSVGFHSSIYKNTDRYWSADQKCFAFHEVKIGIENSSWLSVETAAEDQRESDKSIREWLTCVITKMRCKIIEIICCLILGFVVSDSVSKTLRPIKVHPIKTLNCCLFAQTLYFSLISLIN